MVKETVPQRCFQPNTYISSPASSHFSHHPNNAQNGVSKPYCIGLIQINLCSRVRFGLLWWLSEKEPTCQCRRCEFDPGLGRRPGKGNGNLIQYSYLGNPTDRGAKRHHLVDMKLVTKQQQQRLVVSHSVMSDSLRLHGL